jgi:hypothetical protein
VSHLGKDRVENTSSNNPTVATYGPTENASLNSIWLHQMDQHKNIFPLLPLPSNDYCLPAGM